MQKQLKKDFKEIQKNKKKLLKILKKNRFNPKFAKDKLTNAQKKIKNKSNSFRNNSFFSFKVSGRPFLRKIKREVLSSYSFLTIKIFPNNVFCTLRMQKGDKLRLVNTATSGKYKIKLSKKSLKHKVKLVIASFFRELSEKNILLDSSVAIKLTAPIKIKKPIIKLLAEHLQKKTYVCEVDGKKIFNGCRARKMIRKKRMFFRKYK